MSDPHLPWMSSKKAAEYLDYPDTERGLKNFWEYARRKKIPKYGSVGHRLYHRDDLDRAIGAEDRERHLKLLERAG